MAEVWLVLNNAAVCIFGCILSSVFCGLGKTKKGWLRIAAITGVLLAVLLLYCLVAGAASLRTIYPLLIHLPLAVALCIVTGRPVWSCTSVLTAYLCCQVRRWMALLVVWIFQGGDTVLEVTEILLTVPLLVLLIRSISPVVLELGQRHRKMQSQLLVIPLLYYIYDYLTVVYTDWLYSGTPAVVEFMPFVCCAAYLVFLVRFSAGERRFHMLERDRDCLHIQVSQSVNELAALRQAQEQYICYRHDLRHHLQYLSDCIENGEYDRAQSYISSINREISARKVVVYCENEAINLILSAYAGRAEKADIQMDIRVALGKELNISENDLCVLLSNGMENAFQACSKVTQGEREIQVCGYERDGRFYVQITNTCPGTVVFENGLPVTREAGHGIGTRSIQNIVDSYGGVCTFGMEDGRFILRASI